MATLTLDSPSRTLTVSDLTQAQTRALAYVIQKQGAASILAALEQHVKSAMSTEREKANEEIKQYLDTRLTDEKRDAILAIIRQP